MDLENSKQLKWKQICRYREQMGDFQQKQVSTGQNRWEIKKYKPPVV